METARTKDSPEIATPEPEGWLASPYQEVQEAVHKCKKKKGRILELRISDKNEKRSNQHIAERLRNLPSLFRDWAMGPKRRVHNLPHLNLPNIHCDHFKSLLLLFSALFSRSCNCYLNNLIVSFRKDVQLKTPGYIFGCQQCLYHTIRREPKPKTIFPSDSMPCIKNYEKSEKC